MFSTTFVSAYYEIPNKHDPKLFQEWVNLFLSLTQAQLVIFSTGKPLEWLRIHFPKFYYIDLPFERLITHELKPKFEKQWEMDPEKNLHTMELYMIWNEKPFFVQRAIEKDPFQSTHYCWMDIGMIRDPRLSLLMAEFPRNSGLNTLYSFDRMVLLATESDNLSLFSECDEHGISKINKTPHIMRSINAGVIFGSKVNYIDYIQQYEIYLKLYLEHDIFVGKGQHLIANLNAQFPQKFTLIDAKQIYVWLNAYQKNIWFGMVNILLGTESDRTTHTPELMGGFGNQLFQVAMAYGIARKKCELVVLNKQLTHRNPHSRICYVDTVFKKFLHLPLAYSSKHRERSLHIYDTSLYVPSTSIEHKIYKGYFQHYKYIYPYLKDFKSALDLPIVPETDSFFIHFRFGDFLTNLNHRMDLKEYYIRCLKEIHNLFGKVHYHVFTNDKSIAEKYIQDYLGKYLTDNYSFMESNECQTLSQMANCVRGGICSNSTFSWWGGILNLHPQRKIFFPDQVYPQTSMYRQVDVSGLHCPDFTIIPV
jgi:hypothetical protein